MGRYASYRIDHKAVDAFAREHGLEGPLELRRVKHRRRSWGTHWFHYNTWSHRFWHVIVLEGDRPAADAARTLAHELGHALDAERITREAAEGEGMHAWRNYTRENIREAKANGWKYKQRRHEIDADAFADAHWAELFERAFTVKALAPEPDPTPRQSPDGLAIPTRRVDK